jgi:hypothetical protein
MRVATAMKLSVPSFVEFLIGASLLLHPNVLGALLAPLMFIALVSLIVALAIASKNHERTSKGAWKWLGLAAGLQVLTFFSLGVHR